jgi:hypothetical protein
MSAALATAGGSTDGHSYFGSLGFLDSQSAFAITFPRPTPLLLVHTSRNHMTINLLTVNTALHKFINQCKFYLFIPLFRADYVGTADCDGASSLSATIESLEKLAMSSRAALGHWSNLTPYELFAEYSALTPLLPATVSLWGLNLVTQYHDGLTTNLQDLILADTLYSPPNLASLTTRSAQLDALRTLHIVAVCHYAIMRAHERLISHTLNQRLKTTTAGAATFSATPSHRSSSSTTSDAVSALTQYTRAPTFTLPAEATMNRYQPAPSHQPFPIDPITNFQSPHPLGFPGCLGCGSPDHKFRACTLNQDTTDRITFYKNLFAHKPHLRKRPPDASKMLPVPRPAPPSGPTPTQSFHTQPPLHLPYLSHPVAP